MIYAYFYRSCISCNQTYVFCCLSGQTNEMGVKFRILINYNHKPTWIFKRKIHQIVLDINCVTSLAPFSLFIYLILSATVTEILWFYFTKKGIKVVTKKRSSKFYTSVYRYICFIYLYLFRSRAHFSIFCLLIYFNKTIFIINFFFFISQISIQSNFSFYF